MAKRLRSGVCITVKQLRAEIMAKRLRSGAVKQFLFVNLIRDMKTYVINFMSLKDVVSLSCVNQSWGLEARDLLKRWKTQTNAGLNAVNFSSLQIIIGFGCQQFFEDTMRFKLCRVLMHLLYSDSFESSVQNIQCETSSVMKQITPSGYAVLRCQDKIQVIGNICVFDEEAEMSEEDSDFESDIDDEVFTFCGKNHSFECNTWNQLTDNLIDTLLSKEMNGRGWLDVYYTTPQAKATDKYISTIVKDDQTLKVNNIQPFKRETVGSDLSWMMVTIEIVTHPYSQPKNCESIPRYQANVNLVNKQLNAFEKNRLDWNML